MAKPVVFSKPTFSSADFQAALWALLPRGRVWLRDEGSTQDQVMAAFAPAFTRNAADALALLVDLFPATTTDFITEWEETLGLPDPCTGLDPTLEQRRAQVVARLINSGGQSIPFFEQFAAALGYTITITENAPFRCGQSSTGQYLGEVDRFFLWQVNSDFAVIHFLVGLNTAGDPLATWGSAVLECEIRNAAPAHTVVLFC